MLSFFRNNLDLSCALVLAVISSFFVQISWQNTLNALNLPVLILLFCLMVVVAGFRRVGLLDRLYKKCFNFVDNTRALARLFIFLNFFISMLVTNDVSLIIFVPLAIKALISINRDDLLIPVVSLQTIAANMGSMLTPIGNPQNLFIFTYFNYDIWHFFKVTAPVYIVCGVLLFIFTHFIDKGRLHISKASIPPLPVFKTSVLGVLFCIAIACVLGFVNVYFLLAVVVVAVTFIEKRLFIYADYKLLLLFVLLFIFVNNISSTDMIKEAASDFAGHYEYFVSLCLSQIISNVPATVLLSGFSKNADALLLGVNVGGLGTIIASMASLISFKAYVKVDGAMPLYYLKKFTKYNLYFLLVLVCLHFIFPKLY